MPAEYPSKRVSEIVCVFGQLAGRRAGGDDSQVPVSALISKTISIKVEDADLRQPKVGRPAIRFLVESEAGNVRSCIVQQRTADHARPSNGGRPVVRRKRNILNGTHTAIQIVEHRKVSPKEE